MAYTVHFAHKAAEQIRTFPHSVQLKVLNTLEKEAESIVQEGNKQKRLRRIHVGDYRLVLLEVHPPRQLLVLKAADPQEIFRRLNDLQPPPPVEPEDELVPEIVSEPAEQPINTVHEETPETPAPAEHEPATDAPKTEPVEPAKKDIPTVSQETTPPPPSIQGREVPSLDGLKKSFLEDIIRNGTEFLDPATPRERASIWAREVASSGGTFGFFEMTKLAREVLLGQNEDAKLEALAKMIETARETLKGL